MFAEWVKCPTHPRPSAPLGTPIPEPAYQMGLQLYGVQNVHCVPLDTVIWAISFSSLRWVPNPRPACPNCLPFLPAPAPSTLQAPQVVMPLGFVSQGHKSTWSTWRELTRQSASDKPAFPKRECLESHSTGQPASWLLHSSHKTFNIS